MWRGKAFSSITWFERNNAYFITLNRPSSLNSISLEMYYFILDLAHQASNEGKHIVFSGTGKAFSAGGDIIAIAKEIDNPKETFTAHINLAYFLKEMKTIRIAIMNGITFGGGVGIAWSCSIKVATPKTRWAMPECPIGLIPILGGSKYFANTNPPELGLYLSLTGESLNGADCFLFGFANYYIEANIESVKAEMLHGNLIETVEKYHVDPSESLSKILPIMNQLKYCFDTNGSIELIITKLNFLNTDWSMKTLKKLRENCPLALKISFEAFQRGKLIGFRECLIMEFNLVMKFVNREDFRRAITSKLIKKSHEKIEWNPETLCEIGNSSIQECFRTPREYILNLPRL